MKSRYPASVLLLSAVSLTSFAATWTTIDRDDLGSFDLTEYTLTQNGKSRVSGIEQHCPDN